MRAISLGRPGFAQAAIVTVMTLAALALLGWVLAYWSWVWFAPAPEPRSQPAGGSAASLALAKGLFGSVQQGENRAAPAGIAIRLLGVVAAAGGRRGYAVVQIDRGEILAVREGEEIAPGVGLAEVRPDHVILARSGTRETLTWPEKAAPARGAAAPPVKR